MNFPRRPMDRIRRPIAGVRSPGAIRVWRTSIFNMRRPAMDWRPRTTVSTSGSSGNVDEHVLAFDFHRIGGQLFVVGVEGIRSGATVEFPGVPRAGYRRAAHHSLPDGSALMRTNPIQCVNPLRSLTN